jgi:hypothetical protein
MTRRTVSPFALALVLCMTLATATHAAPILWNTLGSADEVTHSAYGPNLSFFGGGELPEQLGNPDHVPGVFGNGLTLAPGGYLSGGRVRNVVWSGVDQSLSSDRGTIEVWFKQNADPVAFAHGVYRIFDGAYGMGPA